jgi:DNA-binding transcriptional LysR family regulator
MAPALRSGAIDVALSLCPEISGDLAYETIRTEPVVALVASSHRFSRAGSLELGALSTDRFVLFPRELAPRLYDALVGFCRRANFEPAVRTESFHTGWQLQVLADVPVVALAPSSVAVELPEGIVALQIEDDARLETALVWRTDDESAAGAAFRDAARASF